MNYHQVRSFIYGMEDALAGATDPVQAESVEHPTVSAAYRRGQAYVRVRNAIAARVF